ncbi:MAG: hypothetical protein ACI8ZM_003939 [Crocinitomix sp.]|jgi:hypothetical protein
MTITQKVESAHNRSKNNVKNPKPFTTFVRL